MLDKIDRKPTRKDMILDMWAANARTAEISARSGLGIGSIMTIIRRQRAIGDPRATARRRGPRPIQADEFGAYREVADGALTLAERMLVFFEDAIDPDADDLAEASAAFRRQLRDIRRRSFNPVAI